MRLSPVTRANLELTETLRGREKRGTLLWVLDKTSTAMGKRMLRSWIEQPLVSSALINHRLNAVESLVKQTMARGDLVEELHYIADMERLMTRTVREPHELRLVVADDRFQTLYALDLGIVEIFQKRCHGKAHKTVGGNAGGLRPVAAKLVFQRCRHNPCGHARHGH